MKKSYLIIFVIVIIFGFVGSGYFFVSSKKASIEEDSKAFQTRINEITDRFNKLIMTKSENDKYNNFLDISKGIIKDETFEKEEILVKEMNNFYDEIKENNSKEFNKELEEVKKINLKGLSDKNKEQVSKILDNAQKAINESDFILAKDLLEKFKNEVKYAKENKDNEEIRKYLDLAEKNLNNGKFNDANKELNNIDYEKLNNENKVIYSEIKEKVDSLIAISSINGKYKYEELSNKKAAKYSLELEVKTNKDGLVTIKGVEKLVSEIKSEEGEFVQLEDLTNEMLQNGKAVIKEYEIAAVLKANKDSTEEFFGKIQRSGEEERQTKMLVYDNSIELNLYGKKIILKK
ncbi:hypothetical protein [Clostridium chrysemydis]|uniref:hypothetical protein n=1 Tax=Clostridium chrysemydis TaxID=2665504 RepID=UPI0018845D93|nr:hypothetical protein [Clostridium chrysemydis]